MSEYQYTYIFLFLIFIVGFVLLTAVWQINSQVPEECWGASTAFKNAVLGIYTIGIIFVIISIYTVGWTQMTGSQGIIPTASISFYIAFVAALSITLIALCSTIDNEIKKNKSLCKNPPVQWIQTILVVSILALCCCLAHIGFAAYQSKKFSQFG
tara:strand:- start:652 stop:1116 length:465 start_codon:yes stop_codon:yes gene_type:complete